MNEKKNYYGFNIEYLFMQNMTTSGAINIMNRVASVCDERECLVTYIDEATHDCILCFRKEKRERE